jgi:hypothetical protein
MIGTSNRSRFLLHGHCLMGFQVLIRDNSGSMFQYSYYIYDIYMIVGWLSWISVTYKYIQFTISLHFWPFTNYKWLQLVINGIRHSINGVISTYNWYFGPELEWVDSGSLGKSSLFSAHGERWTKSGHLQRTNAKTMMNATNAVSARFTSTSYILFPGFCHIVTIGLKIACNPFRHITSILRHVVSASFTREWRIKLAIEK